MWSSITASVQDISILNVASGNHRMRATVSVDPQIPSDSPMDHQIPSDSPVDPQIPSDSPVDPQIPSDSPVDPQIPSFPCGPSDSLRFHCGPSDSLRFPCGPSDSLRFPCGPSDSDNHKMRVHRCPYVQSVPLLVAVLMGPQCMFVTCIATRTAITHTMNGRAVSLKRKPARVKVMSTTCYSC
jgi:hypothetical protein